MQKRNVLLIEILYRILSRTEMQFIWKQIGEVQLIDRPEPRTPQWWAYRDTEKAVDQWFRTPKLTKAERSKAMEKISQMARDLSQQLQPFELEHGQLPGLRGLMGDRRDGLIRKVLHPEIVSRMDLKGGPGSGLGRSIVADLVPTLPELLTRLADRADDDNRSPPVTKMNAKTAFRSYMIRKVAFFFDRFGIFSPNSVATFVSVAIDDAAVTPDLVRKMYRKIPDEQSE
ncbi:MAG: hypothetical protein IPH39_18790 [Sulfuritalea sp.]|jgi:hypothetical protein|nr:hypothetical protein [Sulfuritalea sp.]MBK9352046.1 hypothetical protein [Sulfuritalea sp.]